MASNHELSVRVRLGAPSQMPVRFTFIAKERGSGSNPEVATERL